MRAVEMVTGCRSENNVPAFQIRYFRFLAWAITHQKLANCGRLRGANMRPLRIDDCSMDIGLGIYNGVMISLDRKFDPVIRYVQMFSWRIKAVADLWWSMGEFF